MIVRRFSFFKLFKVILVQMSAKYPRLTFIEKPRKGTKCRTKNSKRFWIYVSFSYKSTGLKFRNKISKGATGISTIYIQYRDHTIPKTDNQEDEVKGISRQIHGLQISYFNRQQRTSQNFYNSFLSFIYFSLFHLEFIIQFNGSYKPVCFFHLDNSPGIYWSE